MGWSKHMQLHRLLLRQPTGQPHCHNHRLDRLQRLSAHRSNPRWLHRPTPDLALFHANSNKFSGIVSPKIAGLKFLYELDLSNNLFSGAFPTSVLNIPTLSFLDIRFNSFSGTLPPQIFMQTLDVLFLNDNNFMLTLPNNLGNAPVVYLTLANNKFTGPIPRSIGKASSTLIEVLLLNNLLTGVFFIYFWIHNC